MKKLLLTLLMGAAGMSASAYYMLPTPVISSEEIADGKVNISWSVDDPDGNTQFYHVIVYKMHVAKEVEDFCLAQSNFDYMESKGSMTSHEERSAMWDYIPDMPGWYVKSPLYMPKAVGIDCWMNFNASDNDDMFGAAYILSPDYDLSKVTNPAVYVECELGREASSVGGGYALYTYSLDWWDPKNVNYKVVDGEDHFFDDLSESEFKMYTGKCKPNEYLNRTRLSLYGTGYSAMWVNSLYVSVELQPADQVTYASDMYVVEGNNFSIDLSGDTDSDYVYAYQVRGIWEEYDDYRELTKIRAISEFSDMKRVGVSGVEEVSTESAVDISARDGRIYVAGADEAEVYNINGQQIFSGNASAPIVVEANGVYIVKAGDKVEKVII